MLFFASNRRVRWAAKLAPILASLTAIAILAHGQLTAGWLELKAFGGSLTLRIDGEPGWETVVHTDAFGHASLALPYGRYSVSDASSPSGGSITVIIAPMQITRAEFPAEHRAEPTTEFGLWRDTSRAAVLPEGFTFESALATRTPGAVTVPLNLTGLPDNRLALVSVGGLSWTDTHFRLQGMDATDSYQPGRTEILPDSNSLEEIAVGTGAALLTSRSYGVEVNSYLLSPRKSWHGSISTFATGAVLSSDNLPSLARRDHIRQSERFNWFSRDRLDVGGPVTARADLFVSAAGQWASQTVQAAPPGHDQGSRMLFANARSRIRATMHDQFELVFSRSSEELSDWGIPAGIEAFASRRDSPQFQFQEGVPNEAERDNLNFFQIGWTHNVMADAGLGAIEVRYGYSAGHFDTWPSARTDPFQSRIELFGGAISGAPPLTTIASRPRHEIALAWQPRSLTVAGIRQRIAAGGSWSLASPGNRFDSPSGVNLVTADGVPSYVVQYNTPVRSIERVHTLSSYAADHISLGDRLTISIGALADFARGSLPGRRDLISWNSLSPRIAGEWKFPAVPRLLLGASYFRMYAPLAGRYLDYGNPKSLGGSVFQWLDRNSDGWFTPDEQGPVLMHFGGPYASISHGLRRPYADQFDLYGQFAFTRKTVGQVHLFRRDEKNRIAAIDAGLGAPAFTPVSVRDPGPDGIPGTFDDELLTVYRQDPATLGQDWYELTDPPGLRTLNQGFIAEIGTEWRGLMVHASFTVEKAWGPTNPGDAFFENDPGVIGSLFADPNSAALTLARSYVDRAYLGKMQAQYRLPSTFGRVEIATVTNYSDGLPFARQILVTGLPQGPFLAPTTVRGSPEGGNRAQYILNWNLRLKREFQARYGRVGVSADIMNVMNARQEFAQVDLTGPSFNSRLPITIQPSRFVRFGFSYVF